MVPSDCRGVVIDCKILVVGLSSKTKSWMLYISCQLDQAGWGVLAGPDHVGLAILVGFEAFVFVLLFDVRFHSAGPDVA